MAKLFHNHLTMKSSINTLNNHMENLKKVFAKLPNTLHEVTISEDLLAPPKLGDFPIYSLSTNFVLCKEQATKPSPKNPLWTKIHG